MPEINTLGFVIKPTYEDEPDTNDFNDAAKAKLAGIEAGAQVNAVLTVNGQTGNVVITNAVTSVNGQTGTVVLVKADIGLSNVDNTSDANKPLSTADVAALALKADATAIGKAYQGTTAKAGAFPIFKSATVASGVAVFHLTNDGLSTGTALFPNGPFIESVSPIVNDATSSYQMGWALSNSNKTLTVTTNNFTTANILTGLLGQTAANGKVVNLTIWGN